jgi:hypothetical protein
MQNNSESILKVTATVGLLARNKFESEVKNLCFFHNLTIELMEQDNNLFFYNYRIKVSGLLANLIDFKNKLKSTEQE